MPKKKSRSKKNYKVVLADVFFKTLRVTPAELKATRAKASRGVHKHFYLREAGYGVETYKCRGCGDGWGHVLGEERSVRY